MAEGSAGSSSKLRLTAVATAMVAPLLMMAPAWPDNISPHVTGSGRVYSKEPPNSAVYGTGISGRMTEASELRYLGEQDLNSGDIDEAVRKLGKAVQLDPGTPTGHVLYARGITAKFYANKGAVDEKLLSDCLHEWRMLWHHDADHLEQTEARSQALKLGKIVRALAKKKKELDKQMVAERRGDADSASSEARGQSKAESRAENKIEKLRDQGPPDNLDDIDSE